MAGLAHERTWQVWDEQRAHVVRATYHGITGRVRVFVDGALVAERSGWKVGMRGTEIPFAVRSRACALVVRPIGMMTGGQPDLDLIVDGWSVDHGTQVADRLDRERAEPSAVARLVLFFLVPIAIPSALRGAANASGDLVPAALGAIAAGGVGATAVGLWALGRWAASRPPGTARTIGEWTIVAAAYAGFFTVLVVAIAIT